MSRRVTAHSARYDTGVPVYEDLHIRRGSCGGHHGQGLADDHFVQHSSGVGFGLLECVLARPELRVDRYGQLGDSLAFLFALSSTSDGPLLYRAACLNSILWMTGESGELLAVVAGVVALRLSGRDWWYAVICINGADEDPAYRHGSSFPLYGERAALAADLKLDEIPIDEGLGDAVDVDHARGLISFTMSRDERRRGRPCPSEDGAQRSRRRACRSSHALIRRVRWPIWWRGGRGSLGCVGWPVGCRAWT